MTTPRNLPTWLLLLCLLLLAAFAAARHAAPTAAQTDERCFAETDYCISGPIRTFWEQNGGLPVFGLPITPQRTETIEGQALEVQWFERNRLELHPENEPPFNVLLGRLGVDSLEAQQRNWFTFPTDDAAQPGCRYFEATQQNVCGPILAAWGANGLDLGDAGISAAESLALFGLPISPLQTETIAGQELEVQWFERARFELHPENEPPFDVLLGLLGNDLRPDGDAPPITPSPGGELPDSTVWPSIAMADPIEGFVRPAHITHAGDGSNRLFVVEQDGRIRVIRDGQLLPTPFLDITDRVSCCGERGLFSVAFPPDYASKNYFYVDYTDSAGNTMVARYRTTANPDVADPASEEPILQIDQPFANHNGGQLAFGPNDGYLYISTGDGGSGGDPDNYAQNQLSLLGKILRIDVEGSAAPYGVPPTNPFARDAGALPEIWALGLRNPWRFMFDRETGDLYIADVGQEVMEEINVQPSDSQGGENYGWRIMEGTACFQADTCDTAGLTMPVVEYSHADGHCSVTGGGVYRGSAFPDMRGVYFYADYCSGQVWGLRNLNGEWQNQPLYEAPFTITSFGEDESGNLYVTSYGDGRIYRIID